MNKPDPQIQKYIDRLIEEKEIAERKYNLLLKQWQTTYLENEQMKRLWGDSMHREGLLLRQLSTE